MFWGIWQPKEALPPLDSSTKGPFGPLDSLSGMPSQAVSEQGSRREYGRAATRRLQRVVLLHHRISPTGSISLSIRPQHTELHKNFRKTCEKP